MSNEPKPKISRKALSWRSFFLVLSVLLTLALGQAFIIVNYFDYHVIPPKLLTALVLYWVVVAISFSLLTGFNVRRRYETPLRHMKEVAARVAAGDFTARMGVADKERDMDYLDTILRDINKMVDELASIEILKNDFVSNVSHEIKTPLAVIQNYATLLQECDLTEQQRKEYADIISSASDQLSVLVTNILRLSKLENQKITSIPQPYDICGQLGDCILNFETQIEAGQLDFSAQMEDQVIVLADENLVEMIWNNLLSNAIKFTPPGGNITLTQTSDESAVTVSISDTGCGMNEETMKHIFDKFYQGDSSHLQKGNGLGLALVKKVIDLIHGEISVTSEPDQGSTFTVKLQKAGKETDYEN